MTCGRYLYIDVKEYFLLSVLKLGVFFMWTFAGVSLTSSIGVCRVCLETPRPTAAQTRRRLRSGAASVRGPAGRAGAASPTGALAVTAQVSSMGCSETFSVNLS